MVLGLSFFEGGFIDLDLFIKQICFCASSNELCTKDISLAYHKLVLFLEFLLLILNFFYDCFKLILLNKKVFDLFFLLHNVFLEFLDLFLFIFDLLVFLVVLCMLLHQFGLLCVDFLLQLSYLMSHSLVSVRVLLLLFLDLG